MLRKLKHPRYNPFPNEVNGGYLIILKTFLMLFALLTLASCGGGKKSSSSASGNAILPSAPKMTIPTLTFPPTASYSSNSSQLTITGTCSASTGSVVYLGGDENKGVSCSPDGTFTFEVSNESDGTYNYTLHSESLVEHPSDATPLIWKKSTVPPNEPTITTPSSQPLISSDSTITIAGGCVAEGSVSITGDSSQSISCDNGTYSFSVSKSVDGAYTFHLSQTDVYGNVSPQVHFNWTRDTAIPIAPTVASPIPNPYTSSDSILTLNGACTSGSTVKIYQVISSLDQLLGTTSCSNGTYSYEVSEINDGTYNYHLIATSITNISSTVTNFQWVKSSAAPPTPVLTSPNPSFSPFISNSSTLAIEGSCEGTNTVYLTGDSTQSTTCSSNAFSFTVNKGADGEYNFSVYQQAGGTPSGGASTTWIRDTIAPITPVIALPGSSPFYSSASSLIITGACETGADVNLTGDSNKTTTCSSSGFTFNISKTTDGTYNFSISETDAAGNTSSTASQQWIRDTSAPIAPTITSPASNPSITNLNSVTLSGACENNSTVYLTGDSTQNVTCSSSSYSFTVNKTTDSTYNFSISQKDLAGNNSSAASKQWIRDTSAPSQPTITNPSSNPYTSADTNLTISGACETGTTINYSGSSTGSTSCTSGGYSFTVNKSVDGTYTFSISQTDLASNTSSSASFQWTRNTAIPSTPVISTPSTNPYYGKLTSITLSGSCTTGNTVQLSGAGSQSMTCASNAFSFTLTNSTDGTYNYSLAQINGSSTSSGLASFTWVLDRTSPAALIVNSPSTLTVYSSANSITVAGSDPNSCETNATINYSGSATGSLACSSGTYSKTFNNSTDGIYTYIFSQTDLAGNTSSSKTITWHRDTLAPAPPTLSQPGSNPYTSSGGSALTLSGSCEVGATVNLSGASTQSTTCSGLSTYSFSLPAGANGTYNYSITQTDLAGNNSNALNFQWIIDSTIPFTPVVTVPSSSNPNSLTQYSNNSSISVSVTCQTGFSPLPAVVHLIGVLSSDVTSPANTLDQNCTSSPVTYVIQKNTDSLYNLTFYQDNPNNEISSASVTLKWTRDTVAPSLPTITTPSTSPFTGPDNITISGGCETGATVNLTGDSTQSQVCSASTYSFPINKSVDATYTFNLTQTDLAGNTSSIKTQTWIRNSTSLPPPTVATPASNPYSSNASSLIISGTCQANYTVSLGGGDINASEVTNPLNSLTQTCSTGGSYTFEISKTIDGTYIFELTQSFDPSTSSIVNVTWIRDTQAPTPNIATSAPNPNLVDSITFNFSANETSTYQCKIGSASTYQTCSTPTTFTGLTNGASTLYLKATDAVGNVSTEYTYDWTQAGYNTVALYHLDAGIAGEIDDSGLFTANALFINNLTAVGSPASNTGGKLPTSSPRSFTLGTGKYFTLNSNDSINSMNNKMTIEAIFNFNSLTSTAGQYYTLLSHNGSAGNYGWELRLEKQNYGGCTNYVLKFVVSLDGTTQTTATSSCIAISAKAAWWYYTAMTWDNGTINFYMSRNNAAAKGTAIVGTAGSSVIFPSTANLLIGAGISSGTGSSLWLDGSVDEVRLSNIVRPPTSYPNSPFTAD